MDVELIHPVIGGEVPVRGALNALADGEGQIDLILDVKSFRDVGGVAVGVLQGTQ